MGLGSHVQAGVVIGRLDPVNVRDVYKDHLARALDHEAIGFSWKFLALPDSFLGPAQRAVKSFVVEGF